MDDVVFEGKSSVEELEDTLDLSLSEQYLLFEREDRIDSNNNYIRRVDRGRIFKGRLN